MKSVRFITFGCKANQYDTQVLREALVRRGLAEGDRDADLVVVNTCTVTSEAGRKARQVIRRIHRETPHARICVTGCLAESEPEVLRELPGVEWVLGNGEAKRPASFLKSLGYEVDPEELGIPAGITEFAGHTRAFVKIQDGCDKSCAFCIIPKVRGASRSRTVADVCTEVAGLVAAGYVEVVLCGIHIGHWGLDLGLQLADLLGALVRLAPTDPSGTRLPYRLRLSSIEATEVDERVLALMVEHPDRIAPHLHMPMQSGDDAVLARMNRWYTVDEYLAACARIRAVLDRPAFTADILVGFPGEGEAQFANTLATVEAAGFARVHVFPFSARPGTAAAEMRDVVAPSEVRDRRARLSELASELGERYRRSLAGVREMIVLEGFAGLSGRYQRVRLDPEEIDGPPPPSIDVVLEARAKADGSGTELFGRPVARAASAGAASV